MLYLTLSIGLSDAIEYYLLPDVHRYHNCPDIMRMAWKNYNGFYAFLSGVKCAWWLILPLSLFPHNYSVIYWLCCINVLLPVFYKLINEGNMFACHNTLYIVNTAGLIISIASGILRGN
jgi:hypothetical protein